MVHKQTKLQDYCARAVLRYQATAHSMNETALAAKRAIARSSQVSDSKPMGRFAASLMTPNAALRAPSNHSTWVIVPSGLTLAFIRSESSQCIATIVTSYLRALCSTLMLVAIRMVCGSTGRRISGISATSSATFALALAPGRTLRKHFWGLPGRSCYYASSARLSGGSIHDSETELRSHE